MTQRTPGEWVAWYDHDEDGFISGAGVDNAARTVNVCVTTTENVVYNDKLLFNAVVRADTELLASAPRLLATLREVCDAAVVGGDTLADAVRKAINVMARHE